MKHSEPSVIPGHTKYAGSISLARRPARLAPHNLATWRVIEAILDARQVADFWDLAVAVRGHKRFGTENATPQEFVSYCIRRGWLKHVPLDRNK